jgi:hypothetical protein
MTDLLNMLRDERATLARRLAGIDAAIHALNGNVAPKSATKSAPVKRKRKMSEETKAKLRRAAKARWAKIKR